MKIWPKSQPGGGHMIGLENKLNKVSHAGGASSCHNVYDEMSELYKSSKKDTGTGGGGDAQLPS